MLGLLFAQWGARLLVLEMSGPATASALDVGLDWRVLLFTVGVATATALLFGIVPALRSTRVAPNDAIKEQGRSIVGESRFGFGSMLVVAQVALSLVLIVGAGLFMRTFSTLSNVRLGFEPDPILIVERRRQAERRSTPAERADALRAPARRRPRRCPACAAPRCRTSRRSPTASGTR